MKHPVQQLNLTYETAWRCVHCRAAGVVSMPINEAWADTIYPAVVDAHAEQSPTCQHLHSGLALQPVKREIHV